MHPLGGAAGDPVTGATADVAVIVNNLGSATDIEMSIVAAETLAYIGLQYL